MRLFAQPLGEASVEVAHGRDVEAVQPDHGPIGLIAVVVPLPPWSEDQIERLHHSFFTIDRCESPAPLKHETQGAFRVSMAWRDFAGQDQLQSGIQARNDGRLAYEARILENEHASFCLLGADQIACARSEEHTSELQSLMRSSY